MYKIVKQYKSVYNTNRYKLVQNQNKKPIKFAKKSYLSKTLYKSLQNGDSKAFYKYLRQCRENNSNVIPNIKYQNEVADTPANKANMLYNFFYSVFTEDNGLLTPLPDKTVSIKGMDVVVASAGVLKLLAEIEISKSCGPDNVTGIHLKHSLV